MTNVNGVDAKTNVNGVDAKSRRTTLPVMAENLAKRQNVLMRIVKLRLPTHQIFPHHLEQKIPKKSGIHILGS
jgi:hypothetical protein